MINSKFIEVYNVLSKDEKIDFKKMYKSQKNGSNKYIILLFEYIFQLRKITNINVNKRIIYKKVFGNVPYDDLKLRHLLNRSTNVIEDFMVTYYKLNDEFTYYDTLYTYYMSKNKFEEAFRILIKIEGINQLEKIDSKYLYRNAMIIREKLFHLTHNKRLAPENSFLIQLETFTNYAYVEIFKYICQILASKNFTKDNLSNETIKHYLYIINQNSQEINPLLKLYSYVIKFTIDDSKEDEFDNFLELLYENESQISFSEVKELFMLGINFCIKKHNQNYLKYSLIALELYNRGIQNQFLLENGCLTRFTFSNIISIYIKIENLEGAEEFMYKNKGLVLESFQSSTLEFNNIRILYAKKEYNKCAQKIMTTILHDTVWELNAKHILLKVLFETKDFETLENQLITFKSYLKRKANIGYHKDYYSVIINNIFKLYKHFYENKNVIFDINENTPDKEWFLLHIPKKLLKNP